MGRSTERDTCLVLEPDTRIKYITQASIRPPTFIVFPDRKRELHFSAERQLVNRLRDAFGFRGTPIHVKVKFAVNPFEGMRKNEPTKRPPRNTTQKSVKRTGTAKTTTKSSAKPTKKNLGKMGARKAKSGTVRNKQKTKK